MDLYIPIYGDTGHLDASTPTIGNKGSLISVSSLAHTRTHTASKFQCTLSSLGLSWANNSILGLPHAASFLLWNNHFDTPGVQIQHYTLSPVHLSVLPFYPILQAIISCWVRRSHILLAGAVARVISEKELGPWPSIPPMLHLHFSFLFRQLGQSIRIPVLYTWAAFDGVLEVCQSSHPAFLHCSQSGHLKVSQRIVICDNSKFSTIERVKLLSHAPFKSQQLQFKVAVVLVISFSWMKAATGIRNLLLFAIL